MRLPPDQLGNGFMQYYGQDVAASASSDFAVPYDFSVDPDAGEADGSSIPPASDFFWCVAYCRSYKRTALTLFTH